MASSSAFIDGVLGNLVSLGPIRARAMFGGWGLFLDDAMFGLIAGERLYFKVDTETEPRFAAAGAKAFTYSRQGKQIALSYRESPSGLWLRPNVTELSGHHLVGPCLEPDQRVRSDHSALELP